MGFLRHYGNWRQFLMRALGWFHCALLYSLYYGTIYRLMDGEAALPGAMWYGLWSVVPLALADVAAEFCRKLWQFALLSVGICGLAWLLLGSPVAAVPLLPVCFVRGKNRLAEEPKTSVLDYPHIAMLVLYLIPFFYSALGGGPLLQRLCLIWAGMYLLLYGAFLGLQNIEEYLRLNSGMTGVPVRRIVRTSGMALLGMLVLAAALLMPALATQGGYFKIDPKTQQASVEPPEMEMDAPDMGMGLPAELLEAAGSEPWIQIPPFVEYLFYALLGGALLALLLYAAYQALRNFHGSFVDHRDVVQYLKGPEDEDQLAPREKRPRPAVWDRSPTAQVRRKYRRAVLRTAKEKPPRWAAPEEIERLAGLENQQLHELYEKARYSPDGCTAQENRTLKI